MIGVVTNFFQSATIWMTSAGDLVNTTITSWYTTPAIAPPGVPQCRSNPMSSELCAIYYILRYSLLSGTVGSLIVPVAVVDVALFALLTFIRLVRAILARLAEVVKV